MLKEYKELLCCPDDGSSVVLRDAGRFECTRCGRRFSLLSDNLVEMLPSKYPEWGLSENNERMREVENSYKEIFNRAFRWQDKPTGWGNLTGAPPGYRSFVKAERERIRELIGPSDDKLAADVSGGVGNYSVPLSAGMGAMFHCELDVGSIQTAHKSCDGNNIAFIRTPYLKLPFFSDVFDVVICTDTLIRGWKHEKTLLTEMYRILKPGGKAIVDFHNHGLFDGNDAICPYNRKEIASLLTAANIMEYEVYPFGHVPSLLVPHESFYPVLDRIFSFIVPCQRYIVAITKIGGLSVER